MKMSRSSSYDFGTFGDTSQEYLQIVGKTGEYGTHLTLVAANGDIYNFSAGTAERIAKTILDFLEIADRDAHQDSELMEDYE